MSDGAPPDSDTPRTYVELRRALEAVFLRGQREIDVAQVMVYWNTGDLIHRHVAWRGGRAEFGHEVVARLAGDFKVGRRLLYRCLEFRRSYPIVSARTQLLWAHYRVLMRIEDPAKRAAIERTAERQGWNSRQLEQHVRPLLLAQKADPEVAIAAPAAASLMNAKRGTVGVYRLAPGAGGLAVDLGFTAFLELTGAQSDGFQAGNYIRLDPAGKLTPAGTMKPADLYTYRAETLRVVDGDTIWFRVHLGPRFWLKEKVRLRGLDCPEIDTPEGRAAKRFTEKLLATASSVVITTTKPDKYDRYLADVHITTAAGEEIFLNNALLEEGHAVRTDSLSPTDW